MVKKIILALLVLLALPVALQSQTVSLNPTITDSDSQPWFSATYTITLVQSQPGQAYRKDNGQPITTSYSGTTNGSGAFSVTITDASYIIPANSTWNFSICPPVTGAACAVVNIPVTAANSSTVQATLDAATSAPRVTGGRGISAYADVEVANVPNNSYYNLTSLNNRCYANGWGNCSSSVSAGVSSLNTLTGPLTLAQGANITITPSGGNTLTITSTGGSNPGGTTGQVQWNNGGVLAGFTTSGDATLNTSTGALTLASVNSNIGTCGDSTHVGQVTLNAKGLVTACTATLITGAPPFSGISTGTNTTASMVVGSGATLSPSGSGTISANLLTPDPFIQGSITIGFAAGSISATTVSGTFSGDCSSCTGLNMSNAASGTLAIARGGTGNGTAPSSAQIEIAQSSSAYNPKTLSGDATLAATGALTFATVNSNTGACGDATHVCQVTLNGKGLTTAATSVAITALTNPMTTLGDIIYGGAAGAATRLAGPTVGTVPYNLISTPSGGVATAPAWGLPGVPGRTVSGTTDTVAATDRSTSIDFSSASAVAETFTSPATLGNNFSSAEHNIAAGLVTMTLGAGNFLTTGASTKALANGEWCATSSPDNTNIDDRCASGLTTTDATLTPTHSATGIQLAIALGHANTWTALQTFGAFASIAATAHGVLLSENTSAVVATSAGTTGQCLTSNGASSDPTFQTCGVGSGVSTLTGDGTIITNSLSTGAVTLTIAGNSGGIPYFSSASGWASTVLLTNHGLLVGGGAGAGPAALAVGGANFPLIGQASANPTFSTIAYPTSMTTGQLVYGSSSTALAATGVNLSWSSPTLTIGVAGTTTGNLTLASSTATGSVTLTPASAASAFTATLPANTGTVGELNLAETWSALQTFGTNISIGGVTAAGATGTTNVVFSNSPTLVTPTLGAATATSLIASGIVDGEAPITLTTGASCTLGTASGCNATAYDSGYTFNQEATAATAITYTLPTAAAGKQYCVGNSYNGSAATTGTLEILTSASGQFIIYTDGTLSATGGYVQSGGAAGDAACVVGTDSTHWQLYVQRGTWAKH